MEFHLDVNKSEAFKQLVASIKSLVTDATFIAQENALHISFFSGNETVYTHIVLDKIDLIGYKINEPLTFGVNIKLLQRLLCNLTKGDALGFIVNRECTEAIINIACNGSLAVKKEIRFRLTDVDDKAANTQTNDTEGMSVFCEKSSSVVSRLRLFRALGTKVRLCINSAQNVMTWTTTGAYAEQTETLCFKTNREIGKVEIPDDIISRVFTPRKRRIVESRNRETKSFPCVNNNDSDMCTVTLSSNAKDVADFSASFPLPTLVAFSKCLLLGSAVSFALRQSDPLVMTVQMGGLNCRITIVICEV